MAWKLLTCAESKADCESPNQDVEPNPDIAGIGVVVAFLSATCLAFLIAFTVIFLDRYPVLLSFYTRHITKNKRPQQSPQPIPYWRSPAFWSRVLSKNLLAASDTQLLTGLAIQFTALLKHCTITVYHFRIVTDLAFLTTITHLLTVIALRNYFVKNKWINLPRIFFMLANLGLLGYTSFVAYSYDLAGVKLPMQLACFFKEERPPFTAAFGGKWAALLVGAIGGHVTVILAMYWFVPPEPGNPHTWYWRVGAAFRTWIVAPVYSIYGIWMAGDGLRHSQALGTPPREFKMLGSEGEWNFGQFLPVLLLALPVFAGWESFWEEWDFDQDRFGRHGERGSVVASGSGVLEMVGPKRGGGGMQASGDVSAEEKDTESEGKSPGRETRLQSTSGLSLSPRAGGSIRPPGSSRSTSEASPEVPPITPLSPIVLPSR